MKKLITLGAAGLVALTLAGCGNNASSKNSKDNKPKTERKSSQKQTDYFKNDTIKTKDLSLTINQKDLIQFNDYQALRLLFTINNETNNSINNLMDNKIVKASQKINGKDVELPIVDEVVNDNTVQKENKNDHVDAKSTVQSVMYFKIKDGNQPVILTAYNNLGQKIGTETIQLNKIKTINLNNQNSNSNSQQQTVQQNVNTQQQQTNTQQNQQQAAQQPQQNVQHNNQQQYTEQGHYPTWKEGNVYCAQLPDGTVMKQTFVDGDDPGSYQGNPEVQRETAQMQDEWNKEHGIN